MYLVTLDENVDQEPDFTLSLEEGPSRANSAPPRRQLRDTGTSSKSFLCTHRVPGHQVPKVSVYSPVALATNSSSLQSKVLLAKKALRYRSFVA
ncbi:hypothetical protein PI124_g11743 [Phytophthora idaei]|nr:hypothetical protein PI125_g14053 [Phytophthora idaei]KAG3146658.1 hypothetical protein PI126_g13223 [Phytophthora idaei]KAG3243440.1 hypothetical protein PI124_g11743 [Phytophthora idaei]